MTDTDRGNRRADEVLFSGHGRSRWFDYAGRVAVVLQTGMKTCQDLHPSFSLTTRLPAEAFAPMSSDGFVQTRFGVWRHSVEEAMRVMIG